MGEKSERMPDLVKEPYVRGKLIRAQWSELEPSQGVWKWDAMDRDLNDAAELDLNIILVVFSGGHAPMWIYNDGVPRVDTTGTHGEQASVYPYYPNQHL